MWHFVQGCQLCPHRKSLGSMDQALEYVTGPSWGWPVLPLCLRLVTYRLDGDQMFTAMFRNDHCHHSLLLDRCFWLHVCRFDRAPCLHLQVGDDATVMRLQFVCRYKIQPDKNAPLEMKKLMKVVRHVLVNQVHIGAENEGSRSFKVQRKGPFSTI